MALTDLFIRKFLYKGSQSGEKYSDGRGLYLLVKKSEQVLAHELPLRRQAEDHAAGRLL